MTSRPNVLIFMPDQLRGALVGGFDWRLETSDVIPWQGDARF